MSITDHVIAIKDRTDHLHFAREEVAEWASAHLASSTTPGAGRVLDIGLGAGIDLLALMQTCKNKEINVDLYGVESQVRFVGDANKSGITTFPINIESERLPCEDEFFDVVIANHVIEHVKELFWVFGEVSRVLRKGGIAIVGCPNLGAWHNRVSITLGSEPPCMRLTGPHVRGVTKRGFQKFIENEGYFRLIKTKGSNFYPFPSGMNRALAALMPTFAASIHFVIQRTEKDGSFIDTLDSPLCVEQGIVNTPFFRGPRT